MSTIIKYNDAVRHGNEDTVYWVCAYYKPEARKKAKRVQVPQRAIVATTGKVIRGQNVLVLLSENGSVTNKQVSASFLHIYENKHECASAYVALVAEALDEALAYSKTISEQVTQLTNQIKKYANK